MAAQLAAALAEARRMGYALVVGLLSTDEVADLNDTASAANFVDGGQNRRFGGGCSDLHTVGGRRSWTDGQYDEPDGASVI